MPWRRAGPRPLWRSLVDALVFVSVLYIVVMALNRFNAIDLGPSFDVGEYVVVDGDSLRKGQTEIRLVGIDAPEYRQSCNDDRGQAYACGKDAASALRGLIAGGNVSCESHSVDRYQRALSTCRVNTQNINRELVRQGWAVAYAPGGLSFDYMLDEAEARRQKRGLWQGTFETPSDYRKRQRAVQGNVTAVSAPDD